MPFQSCSHKRGPAKPSCTTQHACTPVIPPYIDETPYTHCSFVQYVAWECKRHADGHPVLILIGYGLRLVPDPWPGFDTHHIYCYGRHRHRTLLAGGAYPCLRFGRSCALLFFFFSALLVFWSHQLIIIIIIHGGLLFDAGARTGGGSYYCFYCSGGSTVVVVVQPAVVQSARVLTSSVERSHVCC